MIHHKTSNVKSKLLGLHQNQLALIILLTYSFQMDPDKTKCAGGKFPGDGVSGNVSFVSINYAQKAVLSESGC